jgi:UPF0755 protein
VIAAAGVLALWLLADGTRPYLHSSEKPLFLDIARGTRTSEIAGELESAGVIRSRWTFLALHSLRIGNTLKAGEYSFDHPASPLEVLEKLIRGDVSYQVLTIPEGFNRFEIAGEVAAQGFSTREEFLKATEDPALLADLDPQAESLEGYLYPDSYKFPRHARPAQIVQTLVERFRHVYSGLAAALAQEGLEPAPPARPVPDRPIHDIVILASLIEKETSVAEERSVVAGVFNKRLRQGMALQCDPSVIYAAILENRYDGKIRHSLLRIASPYNTYLHPGLPPGPIANPGKDSLRAALHPASTDYLYFVANPTGGHTFSRTLAEHNLAINVARKEVSEKEEVSQ